MLTAVSSGSCGRQRSKIQIARSSADGDVPPPHCLIEVAVVEGLVHPLLECIEFEVVADEAGLGAVLPSGREFEYRDVVVAVHAGARVPGGEPVQDVAGGEVELLG